MQRKDIKGNVWRHLLVAAVENNGGYSRGYHDRFALSWDVSVNCGIPDFDSIVNEAMLSDYGPGADAVIDPGLLAQVRQEWDDEANQSRMWYWIVEDMVNSVSDDTYKTVRPEIAARYGLAYGPAFPAKYKRREGESAFYPVGKEGWVRDNPYRDALYFNVTWEFHGRSGKHLCLAEFEGKSLSESSDSLAAEILNQEDGYSFYTNVWCQKLLAFIHECDLMFTYKTVREEFHYQVLFRLAQDLQEAADVTKKNVKEAAERLYWEERDCMTV